VSTNESHVNRRELLENDGNSADIHACLSQSFGEEL
jgi:hypothetical protein